MDLAVHKIYGGHAVYLERFISLSIFRAISCISTLSVSYPLEDIATITHRSSCIGSVDDLQASGLQSISVLAVR